MDYNDLQLSEKQYINGVVAKYMDNYIRTNLVWTPEQMYKDFLQYKLQEHAKGWYGPKMRVDGEFVFIHKESELWLVSQDAEEYIMEKYQKKYNKNLTLAKKKGPVIERLRFGIKGSKKYYDLNYGLKMGYNYQKTELVENNDLIPWSINHVNSQLFNEYETTLNEVCLDLFTNDYEKKFFECWAKKYSKDIHVPALIPQVLGDRSLFYYYKSGEKISLTTSFVDTTAINVAYSFALINWYQQIKILIEIDENLNKTILQSNLMSAKSTLASNAGWHFVTFTSKQIESDADECIKNISNIFQK